MRFAKLNKPFKTFACKLPKEDSEGLIAVAEELGFTRSQVMRIAIAKYIRDHRNQKQLSKSHV